MQTFLAKKNQFSKYELTTKKGTWAEVNYTDTPPWAFNGFIFTRHEGDGEFSAVEI